MTQTSQPIPAHCPVCSFSLAEPFFFADPQPLSTLGWPASTAEARAMSRHPLEFLLCPRCSHVWNRAFSYDDVPYSQNPNRMFNNGAIWQGHLAATRDRLVSSLPEAPCVVEIGCGDGHFLQGIATACDRKGRFIGFDPNTSGESGQGIEFLPRLFDALVDIPAFQPDAIVIRHVLEHLTEPAQLIEQLAWGAQALDKPCLLFAETPCIDNVFSTERLADFFYEHVSHFTAMSFRTLLERGGQLAELGHGYGGEVVFGYLELGLPAAYAQQAHQARQFAERSQQHREYIAGQLGELHASGRRIAIWGGTGKAAAFIHHYGADGQRFPLVVDSDRRKVGSFVPGTGQQIQFRDVLKENPVDVIIIPTQWRARDIIAEMKREAIVADTILIENAGRLIDFFADPHPY